jgi:hypothetical protein
MGLGVLVFGLFLGLKHASARMALQTPVISKAVNQRDDLLRATLLAEIPGLEEALGTDRLEAARLLLDWAANAGDFALSVEIARKTTPRVSGLSASELYYDVFLPNRGAVYCGGMATFFDKVLKLFGYNSFVVDFGDAAAGLTHVTVVIAQWEVSRWQYYLFDPTFNLTFQRRTSGTYASVEELMDLRDQGKLLEAIVVDQMLLDRRNFLAVRGDRTDSTRVKVVNDAGDYLVCTIPGYGINMFFHNWRHTFERGGYPPGFQGLVQLLKKRVFRVGPSLDARAAQRFAAKLKARGIPYGPARGL